MRPAKKTAAAEPERRRPPGRPVSVNAETSYALRAPDELIDAMRERAERLGISASEAWRQAAREWLG